MNTESKHTYIKREVEAVEKNPWANDLALTMHRGAKTVLMGKGNAIVNTETGEIGSEMAAMAIRKEVDREEFIKIFEGGIANIFDLNKSARDLFKAILRVYLDQKMMGDKVYINPAVLKEYEYTKSKQTYIQALNILVNSRFLAEVKSMPGWFWVNPMMFFKGDRIKMVQEYAVKGTESAKKMRAETDKFNQQNLQLED